MIKISLLLLVSIITLSACSEQQVFEAGKAHQRSECQHVPPSEYQKCMDAANTQNWQEYEHERKALLED